MNTVARFAIVALMLAVSAVPGRAGNFSFTGNFVNDNDVVLFDFTLLSPITLTLQTWSFGGGFNALGNPISAGGFEPVLQVFDKPSGAADGPTFFPGLYSSCPPNNTDPSRLSFCLDIYTPIFLPAGSYVLALLQNPNAPVGSNNLSDGFQYDSDPNFNNGFVGTFGFQGDSHWAVDILNVGDASQQGGSVTPEPSTVGLFAVGGFLMIFAARSRRRSPGSRS